MPLKRSSIRLLVVTIVVMSVVPNFIIMKSFMPSENHSSELEPPFHRLLSIQQQKQKHYQRHRQRSLEPKQNQAFETINTAINRRYRNSTSRSRGSANVCQGYKGILLISHILPMAGVGTVFFQSILSSLLYAKKYHLVPWIHVNSSTTNTIVYDPIVHGGMMATNDTTNNSTSATVIQQQEQQPQRIISFSHRTGEISSLVGKRWRTMKCKTFLGIRPGPPNKTHFEVQNYTLVGNGLWESYFEPVSIPTELFLDNNKKSVSSSSSSCLSLLPIYQFTLPQATTGMSKCSEIAVRAWPYISTPEALHPAYTNQSIHDWLGDHRRRAAPIIQLYYKPLSFLMDRVHIANPIMDRKCFSMHVRLTDKANGRDKKTVDSYLPFADTFVSVTQHKYPIYLATDDATIIHQVRTRLYPAQVLIQEQAIRSSHATTPVFDVLSHNVHRSNTEALVDIYAMAKCSYFVHGYSGMSEAVVYISPELHAKSINIDDPVMTTIPLKRSLKTFRRKLVRDELFFNKP